MNRIFISLAAVATVLLAASFVLGLGIGNPRADDPSVQSLVQLHFLTSVLALIFAALVHAVALTYFMGTGRWLEETTQAYRLSVQWCAESKRLKYRTVPLMVGCLLLLVFTGASGAAADPASPVGFAGWFGLSAASVHLVVAIVTFFVNVVVNLREYAAIGRNQHLVNSVLSEVRRIRLERGLPVE
jgi:hypothetical protein